MAREKLGKQRVYCDWCGGFDYKEVGIEWSGHAIVVCKSPKCGHEWVETTIVKKESEFLNTIMDSEKLRKIMVEISQGWPDKIDPNAVSRHKK